jgi:murein DD-endopeptidase MepM/ murein hydrolase activator NlpD
MKSVLKKSLWISLTLAFILLLPVKLASAQDEQPSGPVYIVQEGDTLWEIAQRFGVSLEDLSRENGINDPSQLAAGAQLVIPGLEGIQGVLATESVLFGENLRSLSRRYRIPVETLIRLNHLVSPATLYSGANLIVPQNDSQAQAGERIALSAGQSLLELAVIEGTDPWTVVESNGLPGTSVVIPGDVLRLSRQGAPDGPGALPAAITAVELTPLPLVQGDTGVIRLETTGQLSASGSLGGRELHFFADENGDFVALQGVYALAEPGLYPLTLQGTLADGTPFGFSQMVPVHSGDFKYFKLTVPPETIDPANTKPEDELWNTLTVASSPEKMWDGVFQSPVTQPSPCGFTSFFGERRSYNGSPYNYFHTGLDFCYNYNIKVNEIYAPASGVVVFAGPLTVRGNATMIDHGWGVYTGYMHQDEILVEVGDKVETGQVIGIVGGTGRVSGPHLHLEVWVGGVQVDPMDWLEMAFP